MASWDGFEDDQSNSSEIPPSPIRSPFSAAFNTTPRPPGILTNGVREVPASVHEHPEDLYDALEVEFQQAMIQNPEKRHKTRITREERGHLIRHLTMTEEAWKALPTAEKDTVERNRRHKALTYFAMKGTLLMRKPEVVAAGTEHEIRLPLRQAALDDDIYYIIKQTHERLGHAGAKKTYEAVRLDAYGINRDECEWFTDHCRHCELNRPNRGKAPLQPIESGGTNQRCQIDLIDMRSEPSGPYNWILTTKDHFDKFVTLWPLENKTAQEVADVLDIFLMCCGPWEVLQCDRGTEFKAAVSILMRRHGIKVIYSSPRHPESQGLVEQANGQVKRLIRTWKAETGLTNWDLALTTIALQLNHSVSSSTGRKAYELRFNGRSYFTNARWVSFDRRESMRLEIEGENSEQTPGDIWEEGIHEAVSDHRPFDGNAVAGAMPQAKKSRVPRRRSIPISQLPVIPSSPSPSSSPSPQPPSTPTPQEEDDNPDQRAVRRGVDKRAARARELMANKYEKRHQVIEFEIGDFCTIKVPKKDRPSGATTIRLLCRVLRRRGNTYELQTKHGILRSLYGPQNLNRIDQATAEADGREIGNNRRKITLRYAAKAGHTGQKRKIFCGCAGNCQSARCVCHKAGVQCTIYCHPRTGDCPNKATSSAYTQVAIVDASEHEDDEEELEEEL
jgi:IS30 family transposase